jgi:predicted MPP superfamily phosphohydrolase
MIGLRWLHLSDIHFKRNEDYETKRMRDSLIDKLKEIMEEKPIDMVFITGDLAYQGEFDKDLLNFINQIVSILNISKDKLYMVPGNHDLKRTQPRTLMINGARDIKYNFDKDTVDELKKGFKQYDTFCKNFNKNNCNDNYTLIQDGKFNIFLINTALTAGLDNDEGNLMIDKNRFYEVIKGLKDKEDCINIAIGHHPITFFTTESQKIIYNNFNDYNIDLYLCGHLHKGGYEYDLSGQRAIPTYQCGGCLVDEYATTMYIIGDIDFNNKKGSITYYRWMKSEECWIQGGADGRKAVSGRLEINLDRFKLHSNDLINEDYLNEDEFRRFIMNLHEKINKQNVMSINIEPKDVFDKFRNLKCNKSVEKQYNSLSRYFQVIDDIMGSTLLSQIERESIPNIVISEYNKIMAIMSNGNEIIEGIVQNIYDEDVDCFQYSNTTLKTYIKILVYWSIYECDIFNDKL